MSSATVEAFEYLNAGTKLHYRGCGDTPTAARARAARDAGITPAQAERLWKRWRQMASVDGDVYRALRNRYETICHQIETKADGYEAERRSLQDRRNADLQRPVPSGAGMASAQD
ncbi:MAG: hypothetical protein H0W39_01155 [Sphingomonas sp.]|nr:hypothetical protein [Sphingomonas sp.]